MKHAGLSVEVIVVDNASHDGSVEMVQACFPNVRLIVNSKNKGYGNAANQGMLTAQGEWVVLLNPDASVKTGFLVALEGYLAQHPHVGLLGPHVVQPDGTAQSTCRRSYTLATAFFQSTPWEFWFGETPDLKRFYCRDLHETAEARIDWIVGACLIVRRAVVRTVGGFDPRFFMYFEETDWCQRIGEAGWQVAYYPQAQVLHHRSQSASQDLIARALNFHSSRQKFLAKERGLATALLLRGIVGLLFLMYTAQLALRAVRHGRDALLLQDANVFSHVTVWYLTGFPGRGRHMA